MNIMRVDLNLAQVFMALWHERNVSRAARRLALTQPAVSAALRRLRIVCGDELFVRTQRGVRPTVRAAAIAPVMEECVGKLRDILGRRGEYDPASSTRHFLLGCNGGIDYALGAPLTEHIRREAPNVRLTFRRVAPRMEDKALEHREIDLALSVFPGTPHDCLTRPCGSFTFVCVFWPEFVKLPETLKLEELSSYDHIVVEGALEGSFSNTLRNLGIMRTVRTIVPNFGHLLNLLRQPRAIAIVPDYVARAFQMVANIQVQMLPAEAGGGTIFMIHRAAAVEDAGLAYLQALAWNVAVTIMDPLPSLESVWKSGTESSSKEE
jgi:LysR family transcriptional activator of mexEF-oprN operon